MLLQFINSPHYRGQIFLLPPFSIIYASSKLTISAHLRYFICTFYFKFSHPGETKIKRFHWAGRLTPVKYASSFSAKI